MSTNITNQQIDNAVPNKGSSAPHAEQPSRKLINGILKEIAAETNDLGSAAYADVGTASEQIPTNADLGSAAYRDIATTSQAQSGAGTQVLDVDGVNSLLNARFKEMEGSVAIHYTPKGQPCYFYVLPKFNLEDLPGWDSADGTGPHPAFIQKGVVKGYIKIGMYQASLVDGEVVSQPNRTPRVNINYNNALADCRALGGGFDMMSNWDWSAIAMWCMANGFQPRGNSDYGRSHANKWETGRLVDGTLDLGAPDSTGKNTLTGSGPNAWRHDNSPFGIADLVGNVWEWNTGFKLVDGVAHIAPDNGVYSEAEYIDTGFSPAIANPWSNTSNAGAPNILKQALIEPSAMTSPVGYGYRNANGERLVLRGGDRSNGGNVGLGALDLGYERPGAAGSVGFRLTYRD